MLNKQIPDAGQRQNAILRRLQPKTPSAMNKAKYAGKKHLSRDARRQAMERGVK